MSPRKQSTTACPYFLLVSSIDWLRLTKPKKYLQNLEVKKINDEKKAALAAQFAAEATLRRVHAAQKDDDMPPIEAILAPLEAELKLSRQEVILSLYSQLFFICVCADVFLRFLLRLQMFHASSHHGSSNYPSVIYHVLISCGQSVWQVKPCFQIAKLQDDNRALDRLTKQKEAALLEAERTVQIAMAKAAMVDDLQNKNQELIKQIEICHVSGCMQFILYHERQ